MKSDQVEQIIDTILAGTKTPEKVDKKSLVDTLVASKASAIVPPASYQAEVFKAVNEEYEKLILGNQDIDATVKNSQERVNKIIESNQK
ncbi:ABC-type Zn uptake system ZnuABC Zn-binding protein ZnuA [Paenibacillus favisporus]|uniref:ABC-type Zn uptake system ZnuABC Zn-binding protein ZnuA n=1 Tax=Paenibacillus favisporus TaxID=221028 RepID=A0ABV2F6S4_9BACL